MSYKFNVFTGNLDEVGGSTSYWANPVADKAALDAIITDNDGTIRAILSTNDAYRWNLSVWQYVGKVKTSAVGSVPNANGFSIAADNTLTLQRADTTHPGVVPNIGAANGVASLDASGLVPVNQIPPSALERLVIVADQTARFALTTATVQNGDTVKQTDTNVMYFVIDDTNLNNSSGYAIYNAGTAASVAWGGITGIPAPVSALSGTNSGDVTLAAVGSVPNANAATLTGQILNLQPANGTNPGVVTTSAQTFAGTKTFSSTISGSVNGNAATVTTNANLTGPITSVGNATSVASQTGTGSTFVMDTNPTLVTPNLGTPSAAVLTNASGTASALTAGNATNGTTVATTTNASYFPAFFASSTNGNQPFNLGAGLTFNPSTNNLTTTTFTGSLTGSSSLNVLKAGDTMTGPLNMPAGSANIAELTGGTANTGFFFPTSATAAFTSGGTEVWRTGASGITINNTTAQTAGLYIKQVNSNYQGIQLANTNNASIWCLDTIAGNFSILQNGSNDSINLGRTTGYINFFPGAGGGTGTFPFEARFPAAASSNFSTLSQLVPLSGSLLVPVVHCRNALSTSGVMSGFSTSGSSGAAMSFAGSIHTTQTAASEASQYIIATQRAGTLTEALRLSNLGALKLPAYTNPGVLTNDSSGNVTTITNPASAGDINETSFSAANNVSAAADVTGLAFANATVRSAKILLSVYVNATSSLYESFDLLIIQKGATWNISALTVGDSSGFEFTITSAGQIQYTNSNYSGFSAATLKFRAITTSV